MKRNRANVYTMRYVKMTFIMLHITNSCWRSKEMLYSYTLLFSLRQRYIFLSRNRNLLDN